MQSLILLIIVFVAIVVIAILFTNKSVREREQKYEKDRVYPNKK